MPDRVNALLGPQYCYSALLHPFQKAKEAVNELFEKSGAVVGKFFKHPCHFFSIEQHRSSKLAGAPILGAQRFQLQTELECVSAASAMDKHAVVGEQAGATLAQRFQCCF